MTLVWIGSDGRTIDHKFNEDTAKLREFFLAKGLPLAVAEVCAQYEWDDEVVTEMLGE
ncbi:hypothetical protein M3196_11905 [Fictibacillus nanhaiensis]|uniref:hypothetical protein n=1 Tax=Fictibacillus nanhaiensis TaxID=742169 RepID=UPI00203FFD0C|nr:hypothetical protein [Fictibacillus nanhaiensis]MCM3732366.1 hypothetical protein [Fictibacillus nanhaiensis]